MTSPTPPPFPPPGRPGPPGPLPGPDGDGRAPDDPHGAAYDLLAGTAPPGALDEPRPRPDPTPEEDRIRAARPFAVLRRGLRATPELRAGLWFTVALALAQAAGKLAVPVLVQQVLDRGVLGASGFRPGFVYPACAFAAVLVVVLYVVSRATYLRLVSASEASLLGLRVRAFEHIHRLSIAEHDDHRRGALVARVTSDIETLAQFLESGAVAWVVDTLLIAASVGVIAVYSWQLALVVVAVLAPLVLLFRALQRRQLAAQDVVRTAVGETLADVSETVGGAAVIRAYGLEDRARVRVRGAVQRQYRAHMVGARYLALAFPLGDLFGTFALAAVAAAGVIQGPSWGLEVGEVVAVIFLVGLLLNPISELSEIMDQTQVALAGWRKVLGVLAIRNDMPDPEPSRAATLPAGALDVDVTGVAFAYRDGPLVLRDIDVHLPAGALVAIVGETGSGKTTFAGLLCRLADPTAGQVRIGGTELRDVGAASRQQAIRLVPQDGFLFDMTLADNVRAGRLASDTDANGAAARLAEVTDADIAAAFDQLGLRWWLDRLPDGLATRVGERGGNLSVGERQLVALARAQLGNPGLLVLDEATSAVDAETDRALTDALARLAAGRTLVAIAHRLATAEAADLVLVFDGGRIVERGTHETLVQAGGTYARLYRSWLGNTGDDQPGDSPSP